MKVRFVLIEQNFMNVYTKFKLEFYRKIFERFGDREASLSALEVFCVEAIYALGTPSIQEFSNFVGISAPNATYKVNSLIKKGYLYKVQCKDDKRAYRLEVSEKFLEYYGISYDYTKLVVSRMMTRFTKEELQQFDWFLQVICDELMDENEK